MQYQRHQICIHPPKSHIFLWIVVEVYTQYSGERTRTTKQNINFKVKRSYQLICLNLFVHKQVSVQEQKVCKRVTSLNEIYWVLFHLNPPSFTTPIHFRMICVYDNLSHLPIKY